MKLIENRVNPVPLRNPLQTLTIVLTSDEVDYIKSFAIVGSTPWAIEDSLTAFKLIEAIKKVEL